MAFNDEERMGENVKPERYRTQVLAAGQSAPTWMVSALDIDRAIDTLTSTLCRAPVEIEIAEALHISPADYREALRDAEEDAAEESGRWQRK